MAERDREELPKSNARAVMTLDPEAYDVNPIAKPFHGREYSAYRENLTEAIAACAGHRDAVIAASESLLSALKRQSIKEVPLHFRTLREEDFTITGEYLVESVKELAHVA